MSPLPYNGKIFMYPCSGSDIAEPIQTFGEFFDTFLFVDLKYHGGCKMPVIDGWRGVCGSQRKFGSSNHAIRYVQSGRNKYRVVEPEWLVSEYASEETGKLIQVVRRRGFGQYALQELQDNTLSLFMHRGDSPMEGGSNVYYLANRKTSYTPISNLLDVLKCKLTEQALVVSDGSNTRIQELIAAANGDMTVTAFQSHGIQWRRCAKPYALRERSIVWEVSKL